MLPDDIHSPQSRSAITYSKVLLVEGRDAFHFFMALLRHLGILAEIEIRNFGGVDDLTKYLKTLRITPGFTNVNSVGIVRDAEANAASAFDSVCSSLRRAGMNIPQHPMAIAPGQPDVSVFILPDCSNPGMLENLCLQAVRDETAMFCVKDYFQCLDEQSVALPTNKPKAQVQTFLASRTRPGLLLGQAAHAGYWPWDNPAFASLKQFLRAL